MWLWLTRRPRSILAAVLILCVIAVLLRGNLRESIAVIALCVSVPTLIIVYMTFVDWLRQGDRIGHVPHCAVCDYDVAGLTQDICPECGTRRSHETTVNGDRMRRPLRAIAEVALCLAAFLVLVVTAATAILIQIARCFVSFR